MNLGKAIKVFRIQRELSQSELADAAGISVSYLSLLERGKRDPAFTTVERISKALKVPLSILVFVAAEKDELDGVSEELREKLAYLAHDLAGASHG